MRIRGGMGVEFLVGSGIRQSRIGVYSGCFFALSRVERVLWLVNLVEWEAEEVGDVEE